MGNRSRRPRFEVHEFDGKVYVDDDDFGFDASLRVGGDFVDDEKKRFAQVIADVLNENEARIPTADSMRAASSKETGTAPASFGLEINGERQSIKQCPKCERDFIGGESDPFCGSTECIHHG